MGGVQTYRLVRRPAEAGPARLPDPAQEAVVAHTDGPLLVLGGPGTGKTSTLVEAVAARVAAGVDPERILVLTFGRRTATALRHRIEARIAAGTRRVLHEPLVRTFPAYAFGLLRRAAAERGEPSPRLLTGPEQDLVIRELLGVVAGEDAEEEVDDPVGWPEALRPALRTRAFAQQLRDLMMRAAERGVGPAELARLGERLGRADWPAAARFLRQYVAVLALRDVSTRGSVAYDPAELVRAASGLLRDDPELLDAERHRLGYVYVDELADTDPAQIELLELVAGGGRPLVAFADPDSSTYAFRGADPTIVGSFTGRFRTAAGAPAPTLTLHTSYRAGPNLLAATRRLARRLRGPAGHRDLRPAPNVDAGSVEVRVFRSQTSEAAYLAHALRAAHLLDGVPWSRMAVVVRSTARQLPPLQRALHTAGVPTVVHAEDLPLHSQPAVAPLLLLLRCALEPERLDEEAAVTLLHSPLGGADPQREHDQPAEAERERQPNVNASGGVPVKQVRGGRPQHVGGERVGTGRPVPGGDRDRAGTLGLHPDRGRRLGHVAQYRAEPKSVSHRCSRCASSAAVPGRWREYGLFPARPASPRAEWAISRPQGADNRGRGGCNRAEHG